MTSPELTGQHNQSPGSVIVMKSYEENESQFLGRLAPATLANFVATATRPLIMEFDRRLAAKVLASTIRNFELLVLRGLRCTKCVQLKIRGLANNFFSREFFLLKQLFGLVYVKNTNMYQEKFHIKMEMFTYFEYDKIG